MHIHVNKRGGFPHQAPADIAVGKGHVADECGVIVRAFIAAL